jgi:hypothetical protein
VPKNPKFVGLAPSSTKTPRLESAIGKAGYPVWRIGRADFDGPWCPKRMEKAILLEILSKIRDFERAKWPEIERRGSHFIPIDRLIPEARRRLEMLKLDDTDYLFSLRLSGRERLWGLRVNDVFSLLWWDPDHQVCPATLGHT